MSSGGGRVGVLRKQESQAGETPGIEGQGSNNDRGPIPGKPARSGGMRTGKRWPFLGTFLSSAGIPCSHLSPSMPPHLQVTVLAQPRRHWELWNVC